MNQSVIVLILALVLCLNLGSSLSLRTSLENHQSDCDNIYDIEDRAFAAYDYAKNIDAHAR